LTRLDRGRARTAITTAVLALIIIVVLVVAGIGAYFLLTSTSTPTTTTVTSTGITTVTSTGITTVTSTGITTVTSTATVKSPIKVGLITELSGPYASDGGLITDGAQLAVSQINANGGVLGTTLQLIVQDEGSSTTSTVTAAQILVAQDGVSFLSGPFFSGDVSSELPFTNSHNVLQVLSVASGNFLMVSPQNKLLYMVSFPDSGEAFVAENFLLQVHATSAMYEAEDYQYTHEDASFLANFTAAHGINLISSDFYPGDESDYSAAINKIATTMPSAVVVGMSGVNGVDFMEQYLANPVTSKIPVEMVGGLLQNVAEVQTVDASVGGNGANGVFLGYDFTITNKTAALNSQLETTYGIPANEYSAQSYDAIQMLALAIQAAGSTNTTQVANAFAAIHYFGPSGNYAFEPDHIGTLGVGFLTGNLEQLTVTGGSIHYSIVWPPNLANATAFNPSTGQPYS